MTLFCDPPLFTTFEPPETASWAFQYRTAWRTPRSAAASRRLHRLATSDAADGSSAEKAIQNIEADVPARGAPRNEAAIDVVPELQARAATKGFGFPPGIVVLKHLGSVGSRHFCFQWRGRSHPSEFHRSNRTQVPISIKGRPLAQMRWVGKRLPDLFRRVAQFSDENERTCAPLAGPGVYSSRSVTVFSLA